jgi:outer membrane protein
MKIGFVNVAKVIEESPQGDHVKKSLEEEFAPKQQKLMDDEKSLRQLGDRLRRDGALMTESQRSKLERDAVAKERELKRKQDSFREDLNFRRNELLMELQQKVMKTIQDYAKKNQYDLLVAEGVLYASDAIDVTDDIIQLLKASK